MKKLALLGIKGYQRYLSPYKGFHCAFHAHTGRQTCSGYGYRAIERYGAWSGAKLLYRRLQACQQVHQQFYYQQQRQQQRKLQAPHQARQDGVFDMLEACEIIGNIGEGIECLSACPGCWRNPFANKKSRLLIFLIIFFVGIALLHWMFIN